MTIPLLGNFFQSTNASTMTNAATSAVLASTSGFVVPATGQYGVVRVDDVNAAGYNQITGPFEIITFTGNNTGTNTLSGFTRAQEGTSAHAFAAGATWSQVYTKGLAALHPLKVDDQTLVSAAAVTIPQSGTFPTGYSKIHIDVYARSSATGNSDFLQMRINGDNTGNYNFEAQNAAATSVLSVSTFAGTSARVGNIPAAGAGANQFGAGWIEIVNYSQSANRVAWTSMVGGSTPTNMIQDMDSGHYAVLAAVSTITLLPITTPFTFAAGSRFVTTLYP